MMEQLVVTSEAWKSFEESGFCIIELPHDEVVRGNRYEMVFGDESKTVTVIAVQKPEKGPRSHIQLAILSELSPDHFILS